MPTIDKKVINALREMYAHWQLEFDTETARIWNRHLLGYKPQQVVLAIDHAISKSEGYCPKVPDVERVLRTMGAARSSGADPYQRQIDPIISCLETREADPIPQWIESMEPPVQRIAINRMIDWFSMQFTDGRQGFYQFIWRLSGSDVDVLEDFNLAHVQIYLDNLPQGSAGAR